MNGGTREPHVVQIVIQEVSLALIVDKHQGARRRHGDQQIIERLLLDLLVREDDLWKELET